MSGSGRLLALVFRIIERMHLADDLLDDNACYQAITARDARFDGRLFVGVTSTGIYCRPICRVRLPKQENCRFFRTPMQAEAARFRPCLKCRPEIAPGPRLPWNVMESSRTLARQAADLLDQNVSGVGTVALAELARHLGISDRHLRRIFQAEHGVTPLQYVQTRRLLLAKQLLVDTRLSVAQIAEISGFGSLRRFGTVFSDQYRMSPSRLRQAAKPDQAQLARSATGPGSDTGAVNRIVIRGAEAVHLKLAYREPYDVASMLRFMAQHAVPAVEQVVNQCIQRSVRPGILAPVDGWIEVEFSGADGQSGNCVEVRFAPQFATESARVIAAVRLWLDLDAEPAVIDKALSALPGEAGMRLPASLDPFELAVRAIVGQQVTVAGAGTLARRIADRFGAPITTPWPGICRTFPMPEVLAATEIDAIASLGIIRSRARAVRAVAQAWPEILPLLGPRAEAGQLIERLCALPGIGPWTAHYIAMRALGWPDAFPPNDVALLRAIKPLFDTTTQRDADRHAQAWRPWRSYAVMRLWNSLGKTPP